MNYLSPNKIQKTIPTNNRIFSSSDFSSLQPKLTKITAPRLSVASLAVSRSRVAAATESSNSDSSVVMLAAAGDEDG
jgi:hypothetical protein